MLAIIPARGGSKGLPGKNIKLLNGVPLIAYTIKAALDTKCVERVIVTTDDVKIAETAKQYGAEVPFIRPDYLSADDSSAIDVYIHAIEYINSHEGISIDNFMVLLPTVPFRTSTHIQEAYDLFYNNKAETLISVKSAEVPPSWYLYKDEHGCIGNCGFGIKDGVVQNRQKDDNYFVPNGAIYILSYNLLKTKRTYYCENTVGYVMNAHDSIDIDTPDDFMYAQYVAGIK